MPSSQDDGFSAALLSVRIVHIDHYSHNLQSYSTSLPFQAARLTHSSPTQKLPVIRIFGSTPASQSVCVHLHGLRPYLYIPLSSTVTAAETFSYTARLRTALESALRSAYLTDIPDQPQNDTEFLADIEPVLKKDIYGYHPHHRIFLKIHTYAPRTIPRIATIIAQNGLPSDLIPPHTQVYAAHIPFVMQTLIDHGLAGMAYINFSNVRFRKPLPEGRDSAKLFSRPNSHRIFVNGLEKSHPTLFWPFHVAKRSTSALEVDVFPADILNGEEMEGEYAFVSRTLAGLWEEERLRTGAYPPRQKEASRAVKAGPHLSEDMLRERVTELRALDQGVESQVVDEDLAEVLNSQRNVGSLSLPASYDEVLRVLDASGAMTEDEDEVETDQFGNDVDYNEDPDRDEVAVLSLGGQTRAEADACEEPDAAWNDIADCTQHASTNGEGERRVRLRSEEFNGDVHAVRYGESNADPPESISGLQAEGTEIEDSRNNSRRPEPQTDVQDEEDKLVVGKVSSVTRRRTASQDDISQGDDVIVNGTPPAFQQAPSQSKEEATCLDATDQNVTRYYYVRPTERPPQATDILSAGNVGKALSIKYTTPFYGDKADEVHTARAFGGLIIPVRESGAAGYPPFPSHFDNTKIPVEILPRVVRPSELPPTLSELKRASLDAENPSGNSEKQGKFAIDSAGRQVYQRGSTTINNSQLFSYDPAVDFMPRVSNDRTFIENANHTLSESSQEPGFATPQDESALGPTISQSNDSLIQGRPLSPKYDEGYQHYVLPNRVSAASESRGSKTPRSGVRGTTETDSTRFQRNSTVSLSESPHRHQNLTVMSVEILASCYLDKLPDPNQNAVLAISSTTKVDRDGHDSAICRSILLAVENKALPREPGVSILSVETETQLLDAFAQHLRQEDPDVLVGYETQNASIGFILERAQVISHPFAQAASRWITKGGGADGASRSTGQGANAAAVAYYHRKGADIKITGRHVISLWRIVRKEVKLSAYSRETVAAELFQTTFPKHKTGDLECWFNSRRTSTRAVRYLRRISALNIAILDKLNIISRTGELARVFGIDFMDVITRGSQYRVESMLGRVASTRGFLLLSAAREEVFQQPAVEALPLVMEPQSAMYVDPVIVLDFQSLYPSVIIAHNLCFTTMLGNINRLSSWSEPRRIGVVPGYVPLACGDDQPNMTDHIYISSGGEMFVDASIRKGILPQLLKEILETRVMVKKAMKEVVGDDATLGLLNARQFGLKMIANVTYGYTAASFSGRMPCAGLADAIVQCGRDSLEEIVRYVEEELRPQSGATVVYGDTDSLFVKVPGATRDEAFSIGEQIVKRVSEVFPDPITLKLEKVYQPSIMQTKKRYVGYCYESRDQVVPIFDAKGIETVRRDSCPLVQKALEKSIRLLFETKDISIVKKTIKRLSQKLHLDRIPFVDYIFRKEVRLGTYKDGHLPPAAIVATRAIEQDPRRIPRHGERVPYVVLYDRPGAPLKDCVVSPEEYLHAASLGQARLNTTYYITKQILPTLDRIFSLVGVNVMSWYAEIPRPLYDPILPAARKKRTRNNQSSLRMFYTAERCHICHGKSVQQQVCNSCLSTTAETQASHFLLSMRSREHERSFASLSRTCALCTGDLDIKCINLACPVYDERAIAMQKHAALQLVLDDKQIWK